MLFRNWWKAPTITRTATETATRQRIFPPKKSNQPSKYLPTKPRRTQPLITQPLRMEALPKIAPTAARRSQQRSIGKSSVPKIASWPTMKPNTGQSSIRSNTGNGNPSPPDSFFTPGRGNHRQLPRPGKILSQ